MVAPIEHREHLTGDFSEDEYIVLQRKVYRVAEAVRRTVEPERVYVLSLGSQQGYRHVHWHVAPLPYGVPFKQQQLEALGMGKGILAIPDSDLEELSRRIRRNMREIGT